MFTEGRVVFHTPELVYHVEFCVVHPLMNTLSLPAEMRLEPPWQWQGLSQINEHSVSMPNVLSWSIQHRLPHPSSPFPPLLLVLSLAICPAVRRWLFLNSTSVRMRWRRRLLTRWFVVLLWRWCRYRKDSFVGQSDASLCYWPHSPSGFLPQGKRCMLSSVGLRGSHGPRLNRNSICSLFSALTFHYFDSASCSLAICLSVLFKQCPKNNPSHQLSFAFLPFCCALFLFSLLSFPQWLKWTRPSSLLCQLWTAPLQLVCIFPVLP